MCKEADYKTKPRLDRTKSYNGTKAGSNPSRDPGRILLPIQFDGIRENRGYLETDRKALVLLNIT